MVLAVAEEAVRLPPTARLPRLRREPSFEVLENALAYISCLYEPHPSDWPTEICEQLEAASADHTERNYTIDWLTRLISTGLSWVEDDEKRYSACEWAARILEGLSSALESGEVVREFSFPWDEPARLTIVVRDAPLPPSDANSIQGAKEAAAAVGVQTYASSIIMCDLLVRDPLVFHADFPGTIQSANVRPFNVIELGAGTGIVGMTAYKLLTQDSCESEVYITDYHADVMANLRYNLDTYLLKQDSSITRLVCEPLDWRALYAIIHPETEEVGVPCRLPPAHSSSLLLAADVVYDPMHAYWLLAAIKYLLRQPDTDKNARAHILVPIRVGATQWLYLTNDFKMHFAAEGGYR
ncbi:hypothetical protein MPSI1_000936 [Malassezia psittaci]|uniref:Uncharacterized protein n=1 Tax=Malassezia psittaci TaxID=1821823 RepID=A0AAF0F8E6_9BASI|nr:hypothetical protein MPSI1_000936 [Malassezia psittaci]